MLQQVVHGGLPNLIYRIAVQDIFIRVHAGLTAQRNNVAGPLALRLLGLPLHVRRICAQVGHIAPVGRGVVALAAGRLPIALAVRLCVDLTLELVKLRLLLSRQAPPGGAGGAYNFLLPLDPLCLVFHALTSILF